MSDIALRPAAPAPLPAATPMQLLQVAIERGTDVAMLEKLVQLQQQWEANEARKAYVAAKAAFVAERPTITKNKHVGFESRKTGDKTDYDHATLDNVCDIIGPVLSKHGLSHAWELSQSDGKVRVTCTLTHVLGHSERVWLEAGADMSGSKNPIQGIGSTVTYLQRYTLLAICGLATKNQDNDGRGAGGSDDEEMISAEQKAELVALMKETGASTADYLKYLDVPSLDEIPASWFPNAKNALLSKKKKAAAP
jgi:hypothetical protein